MKSVSLRDERGKVYHGWKILIVGIIIVIFGYSCIITMSSLYVLPVTQDLGISVGDFSLYITIFSIVAIISLLILTKWMNKKYIKKIMIIAAICGGISFIGFAVAKSVIYFYVFAVPMGFCFGCLTLAPLTILVSNWFGSRVKGLIMGIMFSTITTMIMINVINQFILHFGWRATFLFIAIMLFVLCLPLTIIFIKWSPEELGIKRMGDTEEDLKAKEGTTGYAGIDFKTGLKRPITWLLFISGSLLVICSSSLLVHSVTFLSLHGYSAAIAGTVYSFMIGGITLGNIVIGPIADRVSVSLASWITVLGFVITFVSGIFIDQAHWLIVPYVLGYSFGAAGVSVTPPLIAKQMYGEKELPQYISYINVFISVGAAFGGAITGKMFDAFGSYTPAWIVLIISILICGVIRSICCTKKYRFVPNTDNSSAASNE
ncbi:MAG: MFS transporter [Anaerovoracaceae bacterium]|jgi:MFS family permease